MATTNWWDGFVGLRDAAAELRWALGTPDAARSEGEAASQRVKRLGTRSQSSATILLDRAVLSAKAGERREAQRLVEQVQARWSGQLVTLQPALHSLQRQIQDVEQVISQAAAPTCMRDLPSSCLSGVCRKFDRQKLGDVGGMTYCSRRSFRW